MAFIVDELLEGASSGVSSGTSGEPSRIWRYGLGEVAAQTPGPLGIVLGHYLGSGINFDDPSGLNAARVPDTDAANIALGNLLVTVGDDESLETVGALQSSVGAVRQTQDDDPRHDQIGNRRLERLPRVVSADTTDIFYPSTGAERGLLGAAPDVDYANGRPEKAVLTRPERGAEPAGRRGSVYVRLIDEYDVEVTVHGPPRQSKFSPPMVAVPPPNNLRGNRRPEGNREGRPEKDAPGNPILKVGDIVSSKHPPDPTPKPWPTISAIPEEEIKQEKMDKTLTYDLEPERTGFLGEEYIGYAFVYGLKATIYKPIKAWLRELVLGERPMYLDKDGNIRKTAFRPDRSAELAVAFGQIALFFAPGPPRASRELASTEAATMGRGTIQTFLENDIAVEYGPNYTRIGNDWETMRVTDSGQRWPYTHDMIVHVGERVGDGVRVLAPGQSIAEFDYVLVETHVAQLAEAVRWNPNLMPGQPIRAISCALAPEQAQALANITRHPVYASRFVVGVGKGFGSRPILQFPRPGYTPEAAAEQLWELYLPQK